MGFISLIRASEVYREPRRFTRSLGGGVALKNTSSEKLFLHVAHTGSGWMERVAESVGHLKIKEKISPVVKSGRAEARNVNLGPGAVPISTRKNRISYLSNEHGFHQGKLSEATEAVETDEDDGEDSIVSGFVGTGRSKSDLARKPCLNTVNEQDGSDLESLVSTFVKNSKLSKSSNQRVQSLENPEMNVGCISCNFCGTAYNDVKGLRRHIKAKHR